MKWALFVQWYYWEYLGLPWKGQVCFFVQFLSGIYSESSSDESDSLELPRSMVKFTMIGEMESPSFSQYCCSISLTWSIVFLMVTGVMSYIACSISTRISSSLNVVLFLAQKLLIMPQMSSIGFRSQWYGGRRSTKWPCFLSKRSTTYSFSGLLTLIKA